MPILTRYNDKGRVFEAGEFLIHPENRAFRYGDGLFETILIAKGQPVFWEEHLKRMLNGMKILGFSFDQGEWCSKMKSVVASLLASQSTDGIGRMRITVYRSDGGHYTPIQDKPDFFAEIHPLEGDIWPMGKAQTIGIAHDFSVQHSILAAVKSLNALPYIMAARLARHQGWDNALLLNNSGEIAESTSANIFLVTPEKLITPHLTSGCLPGVMRAQVLKAAQQLGMNVHEEAVSISQFNEATEAFCTNVIQGLQLIRSIQETSYQSEDFPVLKQLRTSILHQL